MHIRKKRNWKLGKELLTVTSGFSLTPGHSDVSASLILHTIVQQPWELVVYPPAQMLSWIVLSLWWDGQWMQRKRRQSNCPTVNRLFSVVLVSVGACYQDLFSKSDLVPPSCRAHTVFLLYRLQPHDVLVSWTVYPYQLKLQLFMVESNRYK